MNIKLYVINGSHPCATVEKALKMKGLNYKTTELVPPSQAIVMRALFEKRTVPAMKLDGEKLQGSTAILHRLDALAPEPALYPADAAARAKVEDAERWGDEQFQDVARRVLFTALKRDKGALTTFTEGAKIKLPAFMVRMSAPMIVAVEVRMNKVDDAGARADIAALPATLDKIDGWIADGTFGTEAQPTAAALQICPTIQLLRTVGDIRPQFDGRPCLALTEALFPGEVGSVPAGTLPADWLPQRPSAPATEAAPV